MSSERSSSRVFRSRRLFLRSAAPAPKPAAATTAAATPAAGAAKPAGSAEATNSAAARVKELHLLLWDNYKATGVEKWLPDFE